MSPLDRKQLLIILDKIKEIFTIAQSGITESNYENILELLRDISTCVAEMIPWRIGCVKDTYNSELWKDLEYLRQAVNNPEYADCIKIALPEILKDLSNLPIFIKDIIQEEDKLEHQLSLATIDTLSTIEAKQQEYRKKMRESNPRSRFDNIRRLMSFYQDELNLNVMAFYLNNLIQDIELCQADIKYWPSIFRVFEVLGEGSKQLTMNTKAILNTICWNTLENLRNSVGHKADKDNKALREKIDAILSAKPDTAEWVLIMAILKNDIVLLHKHLAQLQTIHRKVRQLDPDKAWANMPVPDNTLKITNEITQYPALVILGDYLHFNLKAIQLELNSSVKVIDLKSSGRASKPVQEETNPTTNAINMATMILFELEKLRWFKDIFADFHAAFLKTPLVRFVCEYEIGDIGEVCKKMLRSSIFKTNSIKDLQNAIVLIDLARDKIMHHQHEIDDDALFNNVDYLLNTVGTSLTISKIKLQLLSQRESMRTIAETYPSLAQNERDPRKSDEEPAKYRKLCTACDSFLKKCTNLDELLKEDWIEKLNIQKSKVEKYYIEAKDKYAKMFRNYATIIFELKNELLKLQPMLLSSKFNSQELSQWHQENIQFCDRLLQAAQQHLQVIHQEIDKNRHFLPNTQANMEKKAKDKENEFRQVNASLQNTK